MSFPRLDEWLVSSGHYPTRARARDAIKRGCVSISGDVSAKPSRSVTDPGAIRIDDPAKRLVSRAGLKLEMALSECDLAPKGKVALDIGASTGGFCQVLLEAGAEKVFAVDVGHGQMDPKISNNSKLVNLEGLNARDLSAEHLQRLSPQFITSDVSFISLKLALPRALDLAASGAHGIFLIKPQFEVGKEFLGKGGIVRDKELAQKTAEELRNWLSDYPDWSATQLLQSPITGGDGNIEYLLIGMKDG